MSKLPLIVFAAVGCLAVIAPETEVAASAASFVAAGVVDEADIAAISDLLDVRSASVLDGDVAGHAATLHPLASENMAAVEARTVAGSEAVGLESYTEHLAKPVIDLTPPRMSAVGVERALTLEVRRVHRVAGFDDRDHVSSIFLTFVETPDGWKVHSDDALAPIGLSGDRELWELFDTGIERRERVLVIGTSTAARHSALADIAEQALARFDVHWTDPWTGRVVMVVPARTNELEALLQPTIDVSKFVAFTTLSVDRTSGYSVVAPRIVAQEANLAQRSPQRQTDILVHELAHVASVVESGPATPLWAHEGLAEWITGGRPASDDGELVLPDLHRFRTGSSADIREVYNQAASTMEQLAARFGDSAPVDLFKSVGDAVRVPGTADYILDEALRDLTGLGLVEVTRCPTDSNGAGLDGVANTVAAPR
jgi:hypothetical protein